MANFSITNSTAMGAGNVQQSISTTYKSMVICGNSSATSANVGAGAFRRGKLYDLLVGTNATPADNYLEFDVELVTLATTPTGIVSTLISSLSSTYALDPADVAFVAAMSINSTGEVGVTAVTERWYVGINQRASYRWVAAPGSEILYPANSSATGSNGLSVRARSGAYTNTATVTTLFQEQ